MKERPILFSGPMVLAILAGQKTQTRRLMKPQPIVTEAGGQWGWQCDTPNEWCYGIWGDDRSWRNATQNGPFTCPYADGDGGAINPDRLWVRESLVMLPDFSWHYDADKAPVELATDDPRYPAMLSWAHHNERERCVSIHMPRWASRITLEITEVRVERLQDISESDAKAEGVAHAVGDDRTAGTHRSAFEYLWGCINGFPGTRGRAGSFSWDMNPFVWVLSFQRVQP